MTIPTFIAVPRARSEDDVISVDFAPRIPAGVLVTSFTVAAEVAADSAQPDAAPADTKDGDPTKQDSIILQKVKADSGVEGAGYVYRFKVILDNGRHLEADVRQTVAKYVR